MLRAFGFRGIEVDPGTIFNDPQYPSYTELRRARGSFREAGITLAGFHWVLRKPPGLNILSDDMDVRRRSWNVLSRLTTAVDDLGGGVLVIGSGKQRRRVGLPPRAAINLLVEELQRLCDQTAESSVTYCLEPLPPSRTNMLNTLSEVAETVTMVGNNRVRAVFDFRNAMHEQIRWTELIHTYSQIIHHVHISEPDGTHPTSRSSYFDSPLAELRRISYSGWVSAELFQLRKPLHETLSETMLCLAPTP